MNRVTILTAVFFLALSGMSFAKGPGAMGGFKMPYGRWWQKPEIAEELDLTADEQEKLDVLFLESQRALIDLRSNVQRQELELEALLEQADFDRRACIDQFDRRVDARSEVARRRFAFHVEVRELLGLDRYRELRATLRDRHRGCMRGEPGAKGFIKGEMLDQ